jgi:adenosine 3'-phospho 5'-phosphosulfate transporter B2
MDFITLASAAHETSQTIVRFLTEDVAGSEDDDFAHLENIGGRSSSLQNSPEVITGGANSYDDTGGYASSNSAYGSAPQMENRPLLSPTAEAALLELSTNFLLYCAMVLITTMVAKIYFPSWLEPREAPKPHLSHNYMDVIRDSYKSDLSDEEDDEDEEELMGGLLTRSEEEDGNNKPESSEEGTSSLRRNASSSYIFDYDQSSESKQSVYTNLAICAIMLNLTFVSWGLLQERMLTRRYPRLTGEYFTYSYALVFTNRFWTLVMSGLMMIYFKPRTSRTTIIYEYSFPSISNMLSSWCQYEALRYVSFPAVTIFKAFKLAPVMVMGKLLGNHSYPQYEYVAAIFIGVGIAMFMTSTDELTFDLDVHGEHTSAKWTGVMLLLFYLFFDSFTSQWQSRMFKSHRDLSMIELMFATSAFSTALSFITLVHDGNLWPAFDFIKRHSEIQLHFFVFSICSTVGQLFIFYTIKNFGAVVFAIIMTTRVLISIAFSVFLYGHNVTATGFFGLVIVVSCVGYRIKRKAEGRQLIKWKGMGEKSEKEVELVQEWHEHIDT